jgi:hypothetical protein
VTQNVEKRHSRVCWRRFRLSLGLVFPPSSRLGRPRLLPRAPSPTLSGQRSSFCGSRAPRRR